MLVLYSLIDAVASAADARNQDGQARRVLELNAILSTAAAVALGIAATGDAGDVLFVLGAWAALAGAAQFAVAIRRRASLGNQWPLLLAGSLSVVARPHLQAWLLSRRGGRLSIAN